MTHDGDSKPRRRGVANIVVARDHRGGYVNPRIERLVVRDPLGIHARPAAALSVAVAKSGARVRLRHGERSADAQSVVQLLSLGITYGSEIVAEIEGSDAALEEAAQALREMCSGF